MHIHDLAPSARVFLYSGRLLCELQLLNLSFSSGLARVRAISHLVFCMGTCVHVCAHSLLH